MRLAALDELTNAEHNVLSTLAVALVQLLGDTDRNVRRSARVALRKLAPETLAEHVSVFVNSLKIHKPIKPSPRKHLGVKS